MKHKGIVTLLVIISVTFVVVTHTDSSGMEHLDDHGSKCSIEFIKSKNKKRYVNKG